MCAYECVQSSHVCTVSLCLHRKHVYIVCTYMHMCEFLHMSCDVCVCTHILNVLRENEGC